MTHNVDIYLMVFYTMYKGGLYAQDILYQLTLGRRRGQNMVDANNNYNTFSFQTVRAS